jgi:hypothetical protein
VIFRARTTLKTPSVLQQTGHVRVCSIVTGGDCLI